jgi:hypothetical protein
MIKPSIGLCRLVYRYQIFGGIYRVILRSGPERSHRTEEELDMRMVPRESTKFAVGGTLLEHARAYGKGILA